MLTYCTNIHPGESWDEVQSGIAANVPQIRDALEQDARAAGEPLANFPIGVWLSGRAAREIAQGGSTRFQDWCAENRCEVQSLNGFPYGDFHAGRVKEQVYLPDWRDAERGEHTARLASILASWLPEGKTGVISTVPLAFKTGGEWGEALVRKHLEQSLAALDGIAQKTGKQIILALEAEPACLLESCDDLLQFFGALRLPESLASHLGICFDCCHHAVEFESPAASLRKLTEAGIRIAQAHVTCALRVPGGELERLSRFSEPVYLHQTVGRRSDGSLVRFDDLPQALAARVDSARDFIEWRVHFHVPVFQSKLGDCETTQPELREMLAVLPRETPLCVETYTFGVLPPELQARTMPESIARELRWVRDERARLGKSSARASHGAASPDSHSAAGADPHGSANPNAPGAR